MWLNVFRSIALTLCLAAQTPVAAQPLSRVDRGPKAPTAGAYLLTPDVITDERGLSADVERGLLFAPENRLDPDSRLIAVHFVRFPAREATDGRAPVFLLPGGPGWDFDLSDPLMFDEVERLRRTRDVVAVSQRGYSGSPGLTPDLRVTYPPRPAGVLVSAREQAEADRLTLAATLARWRARGVDLRGYDILNITDDLNDLRTALGYGKVVLRGCSFGSQWSLAYMKRWPSTVDRAMLSGVEPLDAGYDSPQDLWASMTRVATAAERDPDVAARLPTGGLMAALKVAISRLENAPVNVTIADPSGEGATVVPVGADDLRGALMDLQFGRRRALENLAVWPRFVIEVHEGDYRYLAVLAARRRARTRSESLIIALINHSVGVDARRAADLQAQPAARWLGDVNLKESVTRSVAPTAQIDDAFRASTPTDIPTLLIAGDYDWSTPVENAERLSALLRNGRLVRVQGGRHCTETNHGELSMQAPEVTRRLYDFIDVDFEEASPGAFFETLPTTVSLQPIDFPPIPAQSLYDEWLVRRVQ
jgi:pimeloyl-ACP methyl ester carboxylesterase